MGASDQIVDTLKEAQEKQLEDLSNQLAQERARLREEVDNKQAELERSMALMDKNAESHKHALSRSDARTEELNQDIDKLKQELETERQLRDSHSSNLNKEMLESERLFREQVILIV